MSTYLCLLRWTGKGLENIADSPSRLDAARKVFESAGVTMKDFFMLMGEYDMATIAQAPDDAALAKAILSIAKKGAIQTTTMRAFAESEYRSIISGL
jgi:uncharacterized protein with GYD domain